MLSYVLPSDGKPPSVPSKDRLQLDLDGQESSDPGMDSPEKSGMTNGHGKKVLKSSIISKDNSVSSFASDMTSSSMTPTGVDKPKLKLLSNGSKHTTLKRVSFGSSKGSMVETLIYESPLQEEPESTSPQPAHDVPFPFPADMGEQEEAERSKVRVSFFQSVRAQSVAEQQLEPADAALLEPLTMATSPEHYHRQASTESGWDNPFRPDGDLSREADEIVSLIRGGKPITPTPGGTAASPLPYADETDNCEPDNHGTGQPITQSPQKQTKASTVQSGVKNGTSNGGGAAEGGLEVQRLGPAEPQQPEHVLIKKKPKCKCCVIQ